MMHTQTHAEHSFAASRRAFPRGCRGFTLIELLVVIGIIILLFTVAVPGVRQLLNSGHIDQTLNLMSAATSSARSYTGLTPPFLTGEYQGVALIVTPSNELRFTQNTDKAVNSTGAATNANPTPANVRHGYVDIGGREYVQLPRRVGIVGIGRPEVSGAGTGLPILLAPPFAIRFNKDGALMARNVASKCVYYNGDYNYFDSGSGTYSKPIVLAVGRSTPWDGGSVYDPDLWNANSPKYVASRNTDRTKPGIFFDSGATDHPDNGKLKLPFEQLESVIGIIIFDREEFDAQEFSDGLKAEQEPIGGGGGNVYPINKVARQWILENGQPMFFNRYNGSRIKS